MSKHTFQLVFKNTQVPVPLEDLFVSTSVAGFLAKTVATMTFFNSSDNETEAEVCRNE
jgi:hypothetical protein